ncbi:hypothetical protein ABPG75_011548 [Micractinium tetrahymenae]
MAPKTTINALPDDLLGRIFQLVREQEGSSKPSLFLQPDSEYDSEGEQVVMDDHDEVDEAAADVWLDRKRRMLRRVGPLVRRLDVSDKHVPSELEFWAEQAALGALARCTQLAELCLCWPGRRLPPEAVQALRCQSALTCLQLQGAAAGQLGACAIGVLPQLCSLGLRMHGAWLHCMWKQTRSRRIC